MSEQTHEHQSAHPQTPKLGAGGVEPKCPGDPELLLTALPSLMPNPHGFGHTFLLPTSDFRLLLILLNAQD